MIAASLAGRALLSTADAFVDKQSPFDRQARLCLAGVDVTPAR